MDRAKAVALLAPARVRLRCVSVCDTVKNLLSKRPPPPPAVPATVGVPRRTEWGPVSMTTCP
jgi:hypothetical protein